MAEVKTGVNNNGDISREEIQAAIAKAVELRALHAALMQGNSPSHLRYRSSTSPHHLHHPSHSRPSSQFSGHDYPVFTPSYEDENLPGYGHVQIASQTIIENWDEIRDNQNALPPGLVNLDNNNNNHICPADDCKSVASSCTNNLNFLQNSPGTEVLKSRRRNSLGDLKSVSSCNNYSHATMTAAPHKKSRGMILSWLFKRKQKNENSSPVRTDDQSEEVSQVLKDFGSGASIETLKKELIDANQKKEAALMEVSEMRSSFGELRKKLENLESYCEELKKALRQAVSKREKTSDGRSNEDSEMPVSEEVMVEGFLQIVSEARLSVKQFCKTLIEQIDETDEQLTENLNVILKPYKLSVNSRYSKAVFYHLEAIINQAFYQDFENCVFQKNGMPKLLDPQQQRQAQFQSFASLRNLSWNEVLKKGTKYYSEEFSKFCDQKMSCIIMTLNWTRPWSETLLQSFFVAAKCIWLLHLLAFSFSPPLTILRVEENRSFDPHYMEDIVTDKQKGHGPSRVKIMVMPGFYVQDKILRCKVLCRYKSVV
ncbi:IRK-interacting protein-like isoform X2 [Chenopodium quinoa]|uniref:IRK-interacting protein-like isoform X2 n=1 Tax=Chenopodium quinoa TaxID=63459 RepID=UPI000B79478F|nr:IRK-interacting protein-like isoform X2 [Chenopodium quinoa]XP_021728932.1 IRK-interacting protein-like isoform X2 [Chenopodium quinoa]